MKTNSIRYIKTDRSWAADAAGAEAEGYRLVNRGDGWTPAVWAIPDGIDADTAKKDATRFGFASNVCFTFRQYGPCGWI